MRTRRLRDVPAPVIAALAMLGACSVEPTPDATSESRPVAASTAPRVTKSAPAMIAVDAEGLRLVDPGSGRPTALVFGQAGAQVIAAIERLRGPTRRGHLDECGPGPLDTAAWDDGFTLYLQDGKFAGWALDERSGATIATMSGLAPGSRRADLDNAYSAEVAETTLGTEFAAGAMGGVLDGPGQSAKVTALWAGANCVFR